MVDVTGLKQTDAALVEQLTSGFRTHPQAAANALRAIIEEARSRAAAGDFGSIRDLADRADDVIQDVKAETGLPDEQLLSLAMLAQQFFAVMAIMGGSDGRRDNGYYRAPLAHAERLDAMTGGELRLVDLVNLIGGSGSQEIGESGNREIGGSANEQISE